MNKCLSNLDSRADKQRFLEANHTAFMIPKKFDAATYQKKIDEVSFYFSHLQFLFFIRIGIITATTGLSRLKTSSVYSLVDESFPVRKMIGKIQKNMRM